MKLRALLFSLSRSAMFSLWLASTFITLNALSYTSTAQAAQTEPMIEVTNVYARATPPNAANSAVFATLRNTSEEDRTLLSVSTSAANNVELHDVIHQGDIMKMRKVSQITIPAQQTVTLKSGSLHIMLLELSQPLTDGTTINVTLNYDNGAVQTLIVPVKKVMAGMHKHHH